MWTFPVILAERMGRNTWTVLCISALVCFATTVRDCPRPLCGTAHRMMVLCIEYWVLEGCTLCHMSHFAEPTDAQCWAPGTLEKGPGHPQLLGCKVILKFYQNPSAFWILKKILMYTAITTVLCTSKTYGSLMTLQGHGPAEEAQRSGMHPNVPTTVTGSCE